MRYVIIFLKNICQAMEMAFMTVFVSNIVNDVAISKKSGILFGLLFFFNACAEFRLIGR